MAAPRDQVVRCPGAHLLAPHESDPDAVTNQWQSMASASTRPETVDGTSDCPILGTHHLRLVVLSARGVCDVAMNQGDDEVGCVSASAMAVGTANDQMRLSLGQSLSTSSIGESTEVLVAIGDQTPRVVAGEVSKPVVQAGDTRPPDAKRSVANWEFEAACPSLPSANVTVPRREISAVCFVRQCVDLHSSAGPAIGCLPPTAPPHASIQE
jgi:hypothetical protein